MKYIQETEEWKSARKRAEAEFVRKVKEAKDEVILKAFGMEKKK